MDGSDVELSVSVQRESTTTVVTIGGELEYSTSDGLRTALLDLAQGDTATLVLDMADIQFLDSSGISVLLETDKRCDAHGARFVLRDPPSRVRRVLEVAGVSDVLTIVT